MLYHLFSNLPKFAFMGSFDITSCSMWYGIFAMVFIVSRLQYLLVELYRSYGILYFLVVPFWYPLFSFNLFNPLAQKYIESKCAPESPCFIQVVTLMGFLMALLEFRVYERICCLSTLPLMNLLRMKTTTTHWNNCK